jgi:site-specific DNA recombinase
VPYGYRGDPSTPGNLIVDNDEAAVVRMIFDWLVTEGRSIRAITTALSELGIRAGRGRKWAKSSVRRMLTSELFVGRAWFNQHQRRGMQLRPRQESEWLPISVQPIVPEAVFQSAQAQLAQNRETLAGRPPSRLYLLRGLLRWQCGRKLCGNVSQAAASIGARAR